MDDAEEAFWVVVVATPPTPFPPPFTYPPPFPLSILESRDNRGLKLLEVVFVSDLEEEVDVGVDFFRSSGPFVAAEDVVATDPPPPPPPNDVEANN